MVRRSLYRAALGWIAVATALLLTAAVSAKSYATETIPHEAARYRASLTRAAHSAWGLDAPVPVFAAQIHQESGWNPQAVSRVGAQGMAQFMPATAAWWCARTGENDCQPQNPDWAMRALVGYDRWLFDRVRGDSEGDRIWAALRAYNGGLGHWLNEAGKVRPATDRQSIDAACGRASRAAAHCPENLAYPHRIFMILQPRYRAWGRGVFA